MHQLVQLHIGSSPLPIHQKWLVKYGDSGFVEYITETRIAAAKEMLEQGDLKVYEIAEKLGYESAFYFSKVFKKVTGLSPREYQQSI